VVTISENVMTKIWMMSSCFN